MFPTRSDWKSRGKVAAAALAMLTLTAPACGGMAASAQITSYELGKITPVLADKRLLDRADLFDGSDFADDADFTAVRSYMNDYVKALNAAVGTVNGLTSGARRSAEGEALTAFVEDRLAYGRAMEAAFPSWRDARLAEAAERAEREKAAAEASAKAEAEARAEARAEAEARAAEEAAAAAEADAQTDAAPSGGATSVTPAAPATPLAPPAGDGASDACEAFFDAAMTPQNRDPMSLMIVTMQGNPRRAGDINLVRDLKRVVGEVAPACAIHGEALKTAKCSYARNPLMDPVDWCDVAADGENIIRTMAVTEAAETARTVSSANIQTRDELIAQEGWITKEGALTWEGYFSPAAALPPAAIQRLEPLLEAAGTSLDAAGPEMAAAQGRLADLKAAVLELADEWDTPRQETTNYGSELATKLIVDYRGADKVSGAKGWIERAEWKIHRNSLGAVLRRTQPGYVLYQVKGEPLCQLKSFTLTEQFDGTGYQKAGTVDFGYTRWQACE